MIRVLDNNKYQYHTYQLEEEKQLRVLFGHWQSKCTAAAKCVKCGAAHESRKCQIPREKAARCANCGGAHPASYFGCPSKPTPKLQAMRQPPAARRTNPPTTPQPQAAIVTTRNYSTIARKNLPPPQQAPQRQPGHEQLAHTLQAMQAQMQTFMATMQAQMLALMSSHV
ncbi:hypothetical protein D910_11881 [Dendroctonus ponderosae]